MKKLVSIILVLVTVMACVLAAGCKNTEGSQSNPVTETVEQLWDKVKAVSGFGNMTAVPKADYSDIYGIDASKIDSSIWFVSENPSLNADEGAIFKVNDPEYAAVLAKIFQDRLDRQLQVAKSYSPDEASKIESAEVVAKGNYVYYFVGKAGKAMTDVLKAIIK